MTDRQTQIQHAAIGLFLREGVGVSTARIAKAAGVSNGTLFNVFATKQELIDAIYMSAKTDMMTALGDRLSGDFGRLGLRHLWDGYIRWARAQPELRKGMHLLMDAGLVSAPTKAMADALYASQVAWIAEAHSKGILRGPSVAFICALIFRHLDLVLDQNIEGAAETLAFDMLCDNLGLKS